MVDMPPDFKLKAALAFPHRVAISEPRLLNQRIIGLHIAGSFFPDVWMPELQWHNLIFLGLVTHNRALPNTLK